MKSFKKITSLFIVLTMIVAMFTNVAFAQDITFSDVPADNAYYQAIYNLVNRGVINGYEDGTFKPDNTITRAEFAKVIMVSELGDANIPAAASNFTDTNGHWADKYIAAAVNAGIINGYPEGTFKPDNTVTYAEAVKMVVCALGYGPVIDTTLNPWYTGYIKQASTIGATKGAVSVADNGASRGIVAQLIDNMKDCKRLVQTGTDSSGNPIFNTSSGGSDIFSDDEITEAYGVLIGVYENSLIGSASTLTKSQVQIDNAVYTLDEGVDYTSISRYVGYGIDYKIRESRGRLYVSDITANNSTDIVELDAFYIDTLSGNALYYYTNEDRDDTKSYKLDENLYIVYNGYGIPTAQINSSLKSEVFDIDNGSVKLYNNDSDSAMDVAVIEKYETYFVNTVQKNQTAGTTTITDKLGFQPQIVLDEEDVIVTKVTSAGGAESDSTLSAIASKSVVSIAQPHSSAPNDIPTKVKISTASVSGTVDSMVGDYEIVTVKSKDYMLAECFRDFLDASESNKSTYGFDVQSTVKFFLDYKGNIVCTDVTETSASYGYLIDYLSGSGMDSQIEVRVLTTSSSLKEYPLASTVYVNGESMSDSSALEELKDSSAVINAAKNSDYKATSEVEQLITYELGTQSGKQVIRKIGTVGNGSDGDVKPYEFTYNSATPKKAFADCNTGEKTTYARSTSTFKSNDNKTQFTLDSNSIVFYVPYGREDVDDYKKYTKSKFLDDSYYVEPYDIDGVTAEVVVWYGDDGDDTADITAASPTVIVNKIERALDDDGKTVYALYYTTLGSTTESTANAVSSSVLSGVDVGDIIKIALNGSELDKIAMVYDASEEELYDSTGSVDSSNYIKQTYNGDGLYYQANVGIVYGKPESGEGTLAILEEGSTDEYRTYTINSSTKYYKLETSGSTTTVSTEYTSDSLVQYTDDAVNASKVMIVAYETYVRGVYIIE